MTRIVTYIKGLLLGAFLLLVACNSNDPSQLKMIHQERAGGYVVSVLNSTGTMKNGASTYVLEFRNTTDNKLVDVGKVQISPVMEMAGMAPMIGDAEVTTTDTAGRYDVKGALNMAGLWKFNVKFGQGETVRFNVNAE